jgi:hypothetical protein
MMLVLSIVMFILSLCITYLITKQFPSDAQQPPPIIFYGSLASALFCSICFLFMGYELLKYCIALSGNYDF